MRVSNMQSPRSYNSVANQYLIENNGAEYFQSYQTMIAKNDGGVFTISSNWNYSQTTSKYFYEWLRSYGLGDDLVAIKKWLNNAKDGDTDVSRSFYTLKYVDELTN